MLAAACALAVGCASGRPSAGSAASGAAWPMFKRSADRIGLSRAPGPRPPLKVAWTYRPSVPSNGFQDWGPVAAGGWIFTPSGLSSVVALDAKTGRVGWQVSLVSNVFTVAYAQAQGVLLATTSTTTVATPTLFGLDPATGRTLWQNMVNDQPALGGIEGAPAVDGGIVYVASMLYEGSGSVAAFEVTTGRQLWRWTLPGFSPSTPPAVANGRVIVGFDNKRLYCLDAASGTQVWATESWADPIGAAPVVQGDRVFATSGSTVYALDMAAGQIVWHRSLDGRLGASSPAIHGEWLFLGTRDSRVIAIYTPDGTVGWATSLEAGGIDSSPAIDPSARLLYVGTADNSVVAVDLETGRLVHRLKLGSGQGVWRSSPVIFNSRVYIGSLDQTLYAVSGR
jgi:outer membrane protein assembly factor BamB